MRLQARPHDLERTNRVRSEIAKHARLPAELTVEAAVAAAMGALFERLTRGEAHALMAGVPPPFRLLLDSGESRRDEQPTRRMSRSELVDRVASHLDVTPAHAEIICSAVYTAMRRELDLHLVLAVANQLPQGIKELWLGPPVDAPSLDTHVPTGRIHAVLERDLERRADLPAHVTADAAFSSVMHTLSRRLSGGEVADVVLGLPKDLRPLLANAIEERGEEAAPFGRPELLHEVEHRLAVGQHEALRIACEVIHLAKRLLPQKTIAGVTSQLPDDLRELWLAA